MFSCFSSAPAGPPGGHTPFATASARTRELALRAATENACALISSGVTDSNQCNNTPPDSVRWP